MIVKTRESRRGFVYGEISGIKLPAEAGVRVDGDSVRFAKTEFPDEFACEDWLRKKAPDAEVIHVKGLITKTKAIEIDDTEWASILKHVTNPEKVAREDFRVYRSWLAANVIDRDRERFPLEMLKTFARTLPGKPKMFNHAWYDGIAQGKYYSADLVEVTIEQMLEMAGETPTTNFKAMVKIAKEIDGGLYWLVGKYYVPASERELVGKIDMGIIGMESIGFRAPRIESREDKDGNLLWHEWTSDGNRTGEATEGSFVFLGAQYGAQTGKSAMQAAEGGFSLEDVEDAFEASAAKLLGKQPETKKPEEHRMKKFKFFETEIEFDAENPETGLLACKSIADGEISKVAAEVKTFRDENTALKKVLKAAGLEETATEDQAKKIATDATARRNDVIEEALKFAQLTGAISKEADAVEAQRKTYEKLETEEIASAALGFKGVWEKTNPPKGQIDATADSKNTPKSAADAGDDGENEKNRGKYTQPHNAPNAHLGSLIV